MDDPWMIQKRWDFPWAIGEDFNMVLYKREHWGNFIRACV